MLELAELETKTVEDLRKIATEMGLTGTGSMNKTDLCMHILVKQSEDNGHEYRSGLLEIVNGDRGYLRGASYDPDPAG